jgi:hypothetical protein
MKMANTQIKLLVDSSGDSPVYEMVPAEEIGPRRYRISSSPGFAAGVASGDEIELDSFEKRGFRVVRRSGNICVQIFFSRLLKDEDNAVVARMRSVGGWLDGGMELSQQPGRLLIFTIPARVGFASIERLMSEICTGYHVDRWMYGNVYDDDGQTPLNWWREKR